jgi:hypothetical protein
MLFEPFNAEELGPNGLLRRIGKNGVITPEGTGDKVSQYWDSLSNPGYWPRRIPRSTSFAFSWTASRHRIENIQGTESKRAAGSSKGRVASSVRKSVITPRPRPWSGSHQSMPELAHASQKIWAKGSGDRYFTKIVSDAVNPCDAAGHIARASDYR